MNFVRIAVGVTTVAAVLALTPATSATASGGNTKLTESQQQVVRDTMLADGYSADAAAEIAADPDLASGIVIPSMTTSDSTVSHKSGPSSGITTDSLAHAADPAEASRTRFTRTA